MQSVDKRKLLIASSMAEEGKVDLSVTDSGEGIDPELAKNLFMPFVSSKPDGMGIGLAICRSIIDAHQGQIYAEPAAGGGTVFHVVLPAVEKCIYIVDDDPAVRDSLTVLLEVEGYRPVAFESAEHFLEAWAPDLRGGLLLDVRMPGMDGLELLDRLRQAGNMLPVVVMTGHGDVPLAVRAMKLGALDFIEKPLSDSLLLDAAREMIAYEERQHERHQEQRKARARLAELTPRERDVLEKLVLGHPNKVIAHELDISARTVEVHRARVMEKMEARSPSHLVRMALQAGVEV